jgi:autotransporter passenger strand-loop-strand repeat protein
MIVGSGQLLQVGDAYAEYTTSGTIPGSDPVDRSNESVVYTDYPGVYSFSGAVVTSGGEVDVLSSGTVMSTTLNDGFLEVFSGGTLPAKLDAEPVLIASPDACVLSGVIFSELELIIDSTSATYITNAGCISARVELDDGKAANQSGGSSSGLVCLLQSYCAQAFPHKNQPTDFLH